MLKSIKRKKDALEFNNMMKTLIKNDITETQYDNIIDELSKNIMNEPAIFVAPNSLEFINDVRDVHEGENNTIELFYPLVMTVLLFYVQETKEFDSYNNTKTPLTEIVVNFSDLTSIGIELIGDMCAYDLYFKKFLAYENKECIPIEKPNKLYKEYNTEVAVDLFNW